MFSFAFSVCDPVLGDHGSMVSTLCVLCYAACILYVLLNRAERDHEKISGKEFIGRVHHRQWVGFQPTLTMVGMYPTQSRPPESTVRLMRDQMVLVSDVTTPAQSHSMGQH